MASLLDLIVKYKGESVTVLLVSIAAILVTLFAYIFFNRRRILKYLPGILSLLISVLFLILGFILILKKSGLKSLEIGVFTGVFGAVCILFGFILDLIDSIFKKKKKVKKVNKIKEKK